MKEEGKESKTGHADSEVQNEIPDPSPTPRSERSSHSHHPLHSRRQSNAVQMAKMRKFSTQTKLSAHSRH